MPNIMAIRWQRLYRGTESELTLEDAVAELGVPYRNNFPGFLFGFRYFPDFLLPTLGLVIEVDDDSHDRPEKMLEDAERTAVLEQIGVTTAVGRWTVVRCTNDEARNNPRGAVRAMLSSVGMWPLPAVRPSLRSSLPVPKSCPQKAKREAASQSQRRKQRASRARPKAPASHRRAACRQSRPSGSAAPPPTPSPSA